MALSYSNGIKICARQGKSYENAKGMEHSEWSAFIDHVWKTLDRIKKTSVGRKLISEIDSSGHRCHIFSAGDLMSDPNVAGKWPKAFASDVAASPAPFRPRHKNVPMLKREKEALGLVKQNLTNLGELKKKAQTAPELITILERARAKFPNPIQDLPPKLGITTQDLIEMCLAMRPIDDRTYYYISFYCYDYLTPGPGCDSTVRFQPYDKFVELMKTMPEWDEFNVGILNTEKNKVRNIAAVLLGHELIHCWRMMRGRRVVSMGWEEEGMTVGLGPFLNWPMTENQLRKELGLPLRTKYGTMDANSEPMRMLGYYLNTKAGPSQQFLNDNLIPQRF
jgi:hypothetical protein